VPGLKVACWDNTRLSLDSHKWKPSTVCTIFFSQYPLYKKKIALTTPHFFIIAKAINNINFSNQNTQAQIVFNGCIARRAEAGGVFISDSIRVDALIVVQWNKNASKRTCRPLFVLAYVYRIFSLPSLQGAYIYVHNNSLRLAAKHLGRVNHIRQR